MTLQYPVMLTRVNISLTWRFIEWMTVNADNIWLNVLCIDRFSVEQDHKLSLDKRSRQTAAARTLLLTTLLLLCCSSLGFCQEESGEGQQTNPALSSRHVDAKGKKLDSRLITHPVNCKALLSKELKITERACSWDAYYFLKLITWQKP